MKLLIDNERTVEAYFRPDQNGAAVLVVDGVAQLATAVLDAYVVDATDEELDALRGTGYLLPGAVTLCRDLGLEAAYVAADVVAAGEPPAGDWQRLRGLLQRELTATEREAFVIGWRHGIAASDA